MSADVLQLDHRFDLSSSRSDDRQCSFPVGSYTVCSVQVVPDYNISGAFAVTFYRSNDGVTLSDPEEGVQSLAAAGFTETLDCSGYLFLIAKVTTNATSGFIRVFLCAKADK